MSCMACWMVRGMTVNSWRWRLNLLVARGWFPCSSVFPPVVGCCRGITVLVGVDAESGSVEGSFGFWVCAFGGGVVVTSRLVVFLGFGFVGLTAGDVEFEGETQLHWLPLFGVCVFGGHR